MGETKPGAWTEGERAGLRRLFRYGISIFAAVATALVIVSLASSVLAR